MNRGKLLYVPRELLDELEDLQFEIKLPRKSDCLKVIAKNSRSLREMKIRLNFQKARKNGKY